MSFTTEEEAALRLLLSAFENGKRLEDLPETQGEKDNFIEVSELGESRKLNLSRAIATASAGVCGRYWNESLSSPASAGYYGSLDMLRRLPELLGLGCYLVLDDRSRRKLDPLNHYRFEDGSPAALDGSMGQYMWCWNAFHFAEWKEGNLKYLAISLSAIKGKKDYYIPSGGLSALGGGVLDRTSNLLCSLISDAARYRGGNNNASLDNTFKTQLGMVSTSTSLHNFSAYARSRGQGWEASWYVCAAVVEILYQVIFGNRQAQGSFNSSKDSNGLYQGGLGAGVTDLPSWSAFNGVYPVVPTRIGVELGDGCGEVGYDVLSEDGSVYKNVKVPVFFGLKHPFGHIHRFVRGLVINVGEEKSEVYVAPSLYAGYTDTSVEGLIKVLDAPRGTNGLIKQKSYYLLNAIPTELGATNSTYYCDYYWENSATSKGLRVRLWGAASVYGTNAGPFATNTISSASSTNTLVSAPLCFFEEDPLMTP